ncbi:hypothetical protein M9H77_15048 [Catharanthus roseus]|uniref:Uncharacterized protein n=1 Tax=Catharanthus roseus TaxID=4058 RepID=A0ACC0BPZ1_CATRO|nr:hypothetical protein M9H77_15048 [Catharanthus roseus]
MGPGLGPSFTIRVRVRPYIRALDYKQPHSHITGQNRLQTLGAPSRSALGTTSSKFHEAQHNAKERAVASSTAIPNELHPMAIVASGLSRSRLNWRAEYHRRVETVVSIVSAAFNEHMRRNVHPDIHVSIARIPFTVLTPRRLDHKNVREMEGENILTKKLIKHGRAIMEAS